MAEKSFVNDAVEMLGVAPPEAALLVPAADDVPAADEVAELELELDEELPQPAISAAATNEGMMARFQPAMKASPPLREGAP